MALSGHYTVTERFIALGQMKTHHSTRWGDQIWAKGRITFRKKDEPCAICGQRVGTFAYHPLTNRENRGDRICVPCAEDTQPRP